MHGSCHIGRPIQILSPRIVQIEFSGIQHSARVDFRFIVDDGPIASHTGDGIKTQGHEIRLAKKR
jgi:hypothetical protein